MSRLEGTTGENEICYTGAVYDETTGEHYLRARFYDPGTVVFTAQDTYRETATDESLWNLYAYCNGDPVNKKDPTGHDAILLKSDFISSGIGHLAIMIKHAGNWKYFSWEDKGYKSGYMGSNANTRKYTSVYQNTVRWDINNRFKRYNYKHGKQIWGDKAYRKYIYVKGNFKKSWKYIKKIKKGKSFKGYQFLGHNCAWMALTVLKKGKIGKRKREDINNLLYKKHIRDSGRSVMTVNPTVALYRISAIFNSPIRTIQ